MMQKRREIKQLWLPHEPYNNPKCWVASSYSVHPVMKNQTVKYMRIGKNHHILHRTSRNWIQALQNCRTNFIWWWNCTNPVDQKFHGSTRIMFPHNNNKSRKQSTILLAEAARTSRKKNRTPKDTILLHTRENQEVIG